MNRQIKNQLSLKDRHFALGALRVPNLALALGSDALVAERMAAEGVRGFEKGLGLGLRRTYTY